MKTILGVLLVSGLLVLGGFFYLKQVSAEGSSNFRIAAIKRGELFSTITANGSLQPEETIDIGAQVTGMIKELGLDPKSPTKRVDYGSYVEKGQILAVIDPTAYEAQVRQSQASLLRAQADLGQMKAKFIQAKADLARAEALVKTNAMARSDYDAALANAGVAEANIQVDEAAIEQAEAVLDQANTNLGYTTIVSPIRGVIVDRKVNVGQTVVSAMNTSSLFLLAKDLSRLQVWASVNEADIGRVHVGQSVRFTVSAYRNETFYGKVVQLRLNATTTSNVVIYTVVVETDNSGMKLLPYLTAYLEFELEHHKDVLVVPNAALRWKPRPSQIAPEHRDAAKVILYDKSGGKDSKAGPKDDTDSRKSPADRRAEPEAKSPGDAKQVAAPNADAKAKTLAALKAGGNATPENQGKDESGDPKPVAPPKDSQQYTYIWIKEGNFVRPLRVRVVATDGVMTEVAGSEVQESLEAVIGEEVVTPEGGTTNPLFGKRK